jgi:hypothetical protein
MRRKLQLLFRAANSDSDTLVTELRQEADRAWELIAAKAESGVRVLQWVKGAEEGTVHGQRMRGEKFDAALEIGYEDAPLDEVIRLCDGISDRLGPTVDPAQSYALAGTEYTFSVGETPTVLLVTISRALTQSFEDCHRHWFTVHGWLVKPGADRAGLGYGQFHADPKASSLAARLAGVGRHEFEGTAFGYYPDVDTYRRVMSDPAAFPRVYEDERNFIDFATSAPNLFTVIFSRNSG